MRKDQELGTKPVGSLLLSLAIPAILGQLVSLLYNMVDRMFIGNMPKDGAIALTGIGLSTPIIILISAFSVLIGMGGAPRAAISMGAGRKEEAEKIMGNGFTVLLFLSVVLTGFFLYFNETLLLYFGASEKTLPYALDYMQIYTIGSLFVLLALGMNPFISTQGFAKTSMLTVSIGAILNILLDPIFIYVLDMGVKGAALATIISQAVSAVWVLRFLTSEKSILRLRKEHMLPSKRIILPMILLGISPFIMNATESLLMIVFNTSLQRYGGDLAVGAMTIMASAMQFAFLPLAGFSQGAQPIISFNYGARNPERTREAFRYLLMGSVLYTAGFWAVLFFFPHLFARLFTQNAPLVELTAKGLRIYLLGMIPMGVQVACQQTFIALGRAKVSLFLALLRKIILLIPLIYLLPLFLSDQVFAVWLAEPIADVLAASTTAILFKKQFRMILSQYNSQDA